MDRGEKERECVVVVERQVQVSYCHIKNGVFLGRQCAHLSRDEYTRVYALVSHHALCSVVHYTCDTFMKHTNSRNIIPQMISDSEALLLLSCPQQQSHPVLLYTHTYTHTHTRMH